jgi:alkaline phosphatase D
MKKVSYLLFIFLFTFAGYAQRSDTPYVVLVSLDGFRWDYNKHFDTPNLNRLAIKGVKAKSMKPSYPTKTVPNHYSSNGFVPRSRHHQ